jgi:hypothetical protein
VKIAGDFMGGFAYSDSRWLRRFSLAAAGLTVVLAPLTAHADGMVDPGVVRSWIDMVNASQEAQPHWMTPIITTTPRLEQELRWDFYDQQNGKAPQGNGQRLLNDGGPGGPRVEFIPTYNSQITLGAPPEISASGPRGTQTAPGDWPAFLAKYRFISANEEHGNYIVTGFFQMSVPSGYGAGISNNVLIAQPTIAFGKGWGDFDIQSTISVQVPVDSFFCNPQAQCGTPPKGISAERNFGDPVIWNTAFQYHFWKYFWPAVEVSYTYYPNGQHAGYNQVLLTPELILGRFNLAPRNNLIVGAGYQFAVTNSPVIQNNFVATVRLTF